MQLQQEFTLKGHGVLVTASCVFSEDTLVSGDENGWIIQWNMFTRRPTGVWRGHQERIISIIAIDAGHLLTHGRDSRIRIWQMNDQKSLSSELNFRDENEYPMPTFHEIAVNSLNFCNVSYWENRLVTPATLNSETVDVYLVFVDGEFKPRRLVKLFDGFKVVGTKDNDGFGGLEFEEEPDPGKRDGFGIVMRLHVVGKNEFVVGYENGVVLGVLMDDSGSQLTLNFVENSMVPNPVTWMGLSISDRKILTYGSTTKKLCIYWCDSNSKKILDVGNSGIQLVCMALESPLLLVVGFWNGLIRAINSSDGSTVFKLSRKVPMIETVETNVGREQTEMPRASPYIKMTGMVPIAKITATGNNSSVINYRTRVRMKTDGERLVVTYEDGSIVAFKWIA